jgi:hypothetical protein
MRLKSWTGAVLATIYALIFAGAYFAYWRRAGEFLADMPVTAAALPYLYVARAVTSGEYSFEADMTAHVMAAAAFGCALAYAAGWLVDAVFRAVFGLIWRR